MLGQARFVHTLQVDQRQLRAASFFLLNESTSYPFQFRTAYISSLFHDMMAHARPALLLWGFLSAAGLAAAVPAHPMITPAPVLTPRDLERLERRIDPASYVNSVFKSLGSGVSSFIASGVPQFFNELPTGTAVESSLGIKSSDLDASPTQALMVPPYANWTDQGWNVRIHGNIFKQPNISTDKLNDLANVFLIDEDVEDLPQDQADQARNLTSEIYVVQQDNEQVIVDFVDNAVVNPGSDSGAVGAVGGAQTITMPYNTTVEGDFDSFVVLQNTTSSNGTGHLLPGNETDHLQLLNVYVKGAAETGNATAFLVPSTGITIISDIDDILRKSTRMFHAPVGGTLAC